MPPESSELTRLLGGRLALFQPARGTGYRVNVDALLLARHASLHGPLGHTVDLGAGVGSVGLSLLALGHAERVTLVEREPEAAALAVRNVAPWGTGTRAVVAAEDVVDHRASGPVDAVVCNPPYTEPGAGRAAPVGARDRARRGALQGFMAAAARLSPRVACFVYPASALPALLAEASHVALVPVALRFVHAHASSPARVALVTLVPRRGEGTGHDAAPLVVLPPWSERDQRGPEAELEAFLRGDLRGDLRRDLPRGLRRAAACVSCANAGRVW